MKSKSIIEDEGAVTLTYKTKDISKASRIIKHDDAFGLIHTIEMMIRSELKFESKKSKEKFLGEIANEIYESGLMEIYT